VCERENEKERKSEREKQRLLETHRESEKQRDRGRERERERQRKTESERECIQKGRTGTCVKVTFELLMKACELEKRLHVCIIMAATCLLTAP